jgi:hypothetical protein
MMTETRTPRVTYKGNPALARALALMLEEEGARVRQRRPQAADEQRDLASRLENVASGLLVWALQRRSPPQSTSSASGSPVPAAA